MAIITENQGSDENVLKFPSKEQEERLARYEKFDLQQDGNHYKAFNMELDNELNKKLGHLSYVSANFAGLISKVIADMLFGDAAKYKLQGEKNQAYIDALAFNNKLSTQNYESALSNSARGDAVYKLRIGKRHPLDDQPSIIIEDISPYLYFPDIDQFNMRNNPTREVLAWFVEFNKKTYVRREIHEPGIIRNELFEYNKEKKALGAQVNWNEFFPEEPEEVETLVNRNLIVHIPNWRKGTQFFGTSDYADLEPLFFALNNRLTKVDNILDKHSDPILAVPEGVLDEEGEVRKDRMGLFEMPAEGSEAKPEYIVWNANLESAFAEIDKIVEMLFMTSEVSPETLGLGKGQSDSGRALKFKMLRTIAKKKRKQRYYEQGLKEVFTIAQQLALAWNIDENMDGKRVPRPSEIETPEIEFGEGIVNDTFEQAQEEQIRLASGTTTKKDAIIRLDGIDDDAAEEKVQEIEEAEGLNLPVTDFGMQDEEDSSSEQPTPEDDRR